MKQRLLYPHALSEKTIGQGKEKKESKIITKEPITMDKSEKIALQKMVVKLGTAFQDFEKQLHKEISDENLHKAYEKYLITRNTIFKEYHALIRKFVERKTPMSKKEKASFDELMKELEKTFQDFRACLYEDISDIVFHKEYKRFLASCRTLFEKHKTKLQGISKEYAKNIFAIDIEKHPAQSSGKRTWGSVYNIYTRDVGIKGFGNLDFWLKNLWSPRYWRKNNRERIWRFEMAEWKAWVSWVKHPVKKNFLEEIEKEFVKVDKELKNS